MTLHDLHSGELPLVLPNAWDVPSALAFIDCGFTAIGTTSFGVASCQGSPDGGRSTKVANLALARALARLGCYVSVDIEDGYSDDPDEVADYVAELTSTGTKTAETLIAPADHAAKVRAIKRRSPELFVNARVSTGSLPYRAAIHATAAAAVAVRDGLPIPDAAPYADLQDRLTRYAGGNPPVATGPQ